MEDAKLGKKDRSAAAAAAAVPATEGTSFELSSVQWLVSSAKERRCIDYYCHHCH